jgi:hypothetical protein
MRLFLSRGLLLASLVLLPSAPAHAQLAPFAPYASCATSSVPDCLQSKKMALIRYYGSQVDIVEEKAKRLRYYDLLTHSAINFVVDARNAAEKERQKAASVQDPYVRQRHLDNAQREQRWADDAAKKLVGGTPETHRAHRAAGRSEIEAKFDEDLRVFWEYQLEAMQ